MADTVQITETFEFDDEDPLAQNDWITPIDATGSGPQPLDEMQVVAGLAQATSGAAVAFKDPTTADDGILPLSAEQELRCSCVSYTDGADAWVALYARLDDTISVTSFDANGGYECQLNWDTATTADILLYRYERSAATRTLLSTTSVTANMNSPVQGGLQNLRFTVTSEDVGVRLQAFVNDDQTPIVNSLDLGPSSGIDATTKAAGTWGFGVGEPGVGVDTWEATDKYVIPSLSVHQGRTLEQLRNATKDEISRGGNTNLTDAYLNAQVNSAQQEVMVSIGQLALFTRREETMTFTSEDSKTVEFPQTVEMITEIMHSPSRVPVAWRLEGYTVQNAVRILLGENPNGGGTYIVQYHKRWGDLINDTDRCVIPRMFDEVIVISAALRVAARSADARWEGSLVARYRAAMLRMRAYLNRLKTSEKNRVRVRSNRIFSRDSRYVDSPWQLYGLY